MAQQFCRTRVEVEVAAGAPAAAALVLWRRRSLCALRAPRAFARRSPPAASQQLLYQADPIGT